jgi:hypothetical protein
MRTVSRLNLSLCISAISYRLDGEYRSQKIGTKPVLVKIAPSNHGIKQLALSEQVSLHHFVVQYRAGDGSITRYV